MSKYNVGDRVIEQSTGRIGTIGEVKAYGRGRQLYGVVFSDGLATVLEQNIMLDFNVDNPYERCRRGLYETCSKFKVVNTTYKINNSNNNTISSLKASKTLFKAYQFKPLLKFLESNTRRILIADEVGLGKTIEAGHIMLELKARNELKSALIICPQSLKLKWQTELKDKFGLTFKIYESLNDATEDLISHPNTARGILNYDKIRIQKKEDSKNKQVEPSNKLLDYLKTGQRKYSFVLCDEAHKMRNSDTKTYKGALALFDYVDSIVFLTATPIMLGENDLYNLLHLLDPHNFDNTSIFRNLVNSNKPFIEALSLLNKNDVPLSKIEEVLTESLIEHIYIIGDLERTETILIKDEYKNIPLYEHIIAQLQEPDSLQLRARLQMDISSMSKINNIFSRTRKREIATDEREKNERNAHKELVRLTDDEQNLYDKVVKDYESYSGYVETEEYSRQNQGAKLGLHAVKRMLASSIIATELWREASGNIIKFEALICNCLNKVDSKFDKLCEIIEGVKNTGANKLIVFSIFKFTIRYLAKKLEKIGISCYVIHGDVSERDVVIQQFKADNRFSVLLSNEVGSEGLDMQFCSHMVNYDLPWNPMVIEQRIGRIDRFGQKSPKIQIYNLVVKNSIMEVVYDRLLMRIGVFKGVIGELEVILEEFAEQFNKLEKEIYETSLTEEEQIAKVNDIAKAVETGKLNLQKVEEGLTNTLTNDYYFRNEINKIRDKDLYVTEKEILNYLNSLVEYKLTTCEFNKNENGFYCLTFPKSSSNLLPNFLSENQPIGEEYDDLFRVYIQQFKEKIGIENNYIFTIDQNIAFDRKDLDYVNIYNPIVVAASKYFEEKLNSIGNTFKLKIDKSKIDSQKSIVKLEEGVYFIAIYVINTTILSLGRIVKSDILVPIVYNVKSDSIITDKELNRDYFGTLQSDGEDLMLQEDIVDIPENAYDNMESDFADYIANYIKEQKRDTKMRIDSQREMSIRQTNEYYKIRKEKALKDIKEAEFYVETSSIDERKNAENILRLAYNRLKMVDDAHNTALDKLNKIEEPKLTYKLISLCKFIIV